MSSMIRNHCIILGQLGLKLVVILWCSIVFEQSASLLKRSELVIKNMSKKLLFAVLLCVFCFSVSGFSEDFKLHKGDEIGLKEYRLSYGDVGDNTYFELGVDEGDTVMILEQVSRDTIYEEEEISFNPSEDIEVRINGVGSDGDGLYLNVSVVGPESFFADAELKSSAPRRVFVGQGDEVTVPLTLNNNGVINQTFNLSAVQNSSAAVSFSYQDFNITQLQVDAGEEESINAKFDVPETAEPGTYDVRFVAEDRSKAVESTVIEIRESSSGEERKRIDLSSRQSYVRIKPGKSKEISVRVRNEGDAVLDNVKLSVESSENWDAEISRESVPALDQYESFRSIVTVTAPANAEKGDKFLEISASSDETSTEEPERIRLTVQKQSNLRYIGLGIMALSLGGLVFVYRKLGRR